MKIVIIVLILITLIFVAFVVRGALREEPDPPRPEQLKGTAKTTKGPGWTESIKEAFSSLKPGLKLEKDSYSGPAEQKIPADEKHPFRTATFRLMPGSGPARIRYEDKTQIEPGSPMRKMDNPQVCELPQDPDEADDVNVCSIVAMKGGGTFKFECADNNKPCRVKVE